ncbi:MAG: hypothetical protein H6Q84_1801, partial [Deltaproteobacteria bacterium]|nr:hypothetical protein [Deltaproteobacteria bacterium]
ASGVNEGAVSFSLWLCGIISFGLFQN